MVARGFASHTASGVERGTGGDQLHALPITLRCGSPVPNRFRLYCVGFPTNSHRTNMRRCKPGLSDWLIDVASLFIILLSLAIELFLVAVKITFVLVLPFLVLYILLLLQGISIT